MSCRSVYLVAFLWVIFTFSSLLAGQSADSFAPTTSENPAVLDQLWQRAVAKYDGERSKILKHVDEVNAAGPFRTDWESLKAYQVPDWYKDAKFGIFLHWGVYSVPAFGSEWYPRLMYIPGTPEHRHHLETYGTPDKFGYKDFIPKFKAENYDPEAWAELFKESGAKYVVPVFEHHDGFQMYDSALSDWTAVKVGPHRDLWGDLAKAVRAQGLRLGASSHRVEHNFFLGVGRAIRSDVNDPQNASLYGPAHNWLEAKSGTPLSNDYTYVSSAWTHDWLARSAEIVEKYHPDLIYFDWWIGQPSVRTDLTRFAAFYYNTSSKNGGTVGVINYKDWAMQPQSAVLDVERGQLGEIRQDKWQTDTSISNKSWGYIENDTFKSPQSIVQLLADVVSKNGNLLLNVGPKSDGTIPGPAQSILREIGGWLKVNGEGIYATKPWRVYGEGPTKPAEGAFHEGDLPYTPQDFRFTSKGDVLYAIEMAPPSGEVVIRALATGITGQQRVDAVSQLGASALAFEQKDDGLHLKPAAQSGRFPVVYRIQFSPH
ncbi:MAG TPA: alpha-L-fucosidase [Terriglobales bacterium]|jgi:alpha-L-fucosidase|nr:alpha-L-fucosidase [Terriglobales bacterium]